MQGIFTKRTLFAARLAEMSNKCKPGFKERHKDMF